MRKRKSSKKALALMVSVVLLVTVAVGATLAYLISIPDPIKNTFTPSHVTVKVNEGTEEVPFNGVTKTNVRIENTGDTSAYIRAAVIVTWQNAAGDVYGKAPVEGTDYTITYNLPTEPVADGKWVEKDGYYYWTKPVAAGANTGILITSAAPVPGKAPAGYSLCIEIIASGIQSDGTNGTESAVKNAWGIDLTDNG